MTAARQTTSDPTDPFAGTRYCDIVMKGGITSGVVYPLAVCELARTYHLRSIGGTSAGAIAASCAAAAEYGRNRGGTSFGELETLPLWLGQAAPGGGSNLFSLFQPQPATARLFHTAVAALGPSKGIWWRLVRAGTRQYWPFALVGIGPGLLLAVLAGLAWQSAGWLFPGWALVSALAIGVLGPILAVGGAFGWQAIHAIPANAYGLCSGCGDSIPGRAQPLTTWLADIIDRLAGKPSTEDPLTFGDLWGDLPDGEPAIDLQMMTTSLTHGRPYRLPFEEDTFYFDSGDLRRLFPDRIVAWMEDNPRPTTASEQYGPLHPLPAANNLPVVVAARLSLSFPILLSAVKLYALDPTRRKPDEAARLWPCWFSDGGISSNFPVHFFDRPLPRWPTFALNLNEVHPDFPLDEKDQSNNVWMIERNVDGNTESWTRFDARPRPGQLWSFAVAIMNAMQNWADNTQLRVPGYRDRVAHISLGEGEGGLNLNMPPDRIKNLAERGQHAGAKLVKRYTIGKGEISWENHRWVRYRVSMALIEDWLGRLRRAYEHPAARDRPYPRLVGRRANQDPASYPWQLGQRVFAMRATEDLVDLIDSWTASGQSFEAGAPPPLPELRVRPRI